MPLNRYPSLPSIDTVAVESSAIRPKFFGSIDANLGRARAYQNSETDLLPTSALMESQGDSE
jgi:hypothetical protein